MLLHSRPIPVKLEVAMSSEHATAARQMSPLMSLDDARRVLRIRKSALYDLINDGTIDVIRRGRARYISDRALRAAIRKMEAAAKDPV